MNHFSNASPLHKNSFTFGMFMLHQSFYIFPLLVGILVQKIYEFVVLIFDVSQLGNKFLFTFFLHFLVFLKLFCVRMFIGVMLIKPMF